MAGLGQIFSKGVLLVFRTIARAEMRCCPKTRPRSSADWQPSMYWAGAGRGAVQDIEVNANRIAVEEKASRCFFLDWRSAHFAAKLFPRSDHAIENSQISLNILGFDPHIRRGGWICVNKPITAGSRTAKLIASDFCKRMRII